MICFYDLAEIPPWLVIIMCLFIRDRDVHGCELHVWVRSNITSRTMQKRK